MCAPKLEEGTKLDFLPLSNQFWMRRCQFARGLPFGGCRHYLGFPLGGCKLTIAYIAYCKLTIAYPSGANTWCKSNSRRLHCSPKHKHKHKYKYKFQFQLEMHRPLISQSWKSETLCTIYSSFSDFQDENIWSSRLKKRASQILRIWAIMQLGSFSSENSVSGRIVKCAHQPT